MQEKILFPHSKIRRIQEDMIKEVITAFENGEHAIIHAPTGLGKTAATLSVALPFALKKKLTVFFLTSRHTQHHIAIDTLRLIKKKFKVDFNVTDIIGKQWMCALGEVDKLYSNEFTEYCKKLREEGNCEFYLNTKKKSGKVSVKALQILETLKSLGPMHCDKLKEICIKEGLCPYEMATLLAKESDIVIADYYYIFNPKIRDVFFNKSEKELEKSIIIIDEAHNLPKRCRELLSFNLSSFMLERGKKESTKFGFDETHRYLMIIEEALEKLRLGTKKDKDERLVKKEDFFNEINSKIDYNLLVDDFNFVGGEVREKQKQSYIGSIGNFLEAWLGQDKGFARILSERVRAKRRDLVLSYRCLDPSFVSKEVIARAYSIICMSGTLTPTKMYADLLGFENVRQRVFESPFPKKNKLALIVPGATTRFRKRKDEEFEKIAKIVSEIVNLIPGNSLVFFPSYELRDKIYLKLIGLCKKDVLIERPRLKKEEKKELLEIFKRYKNKGACLLCVTAGSFGEGIDLPGDFLKGVIVVGLPLEKPDLEVMELIDYYDEKYGKGWMYGYIFPAMIRTMQNAGRCIRSSKDRGVVVFLDERYIDRKYYSCFPPDYGITISRNYKERIKEFFDETL